VSHRGQLRGEVEGEGEGEACLGVAIVKLDRLASERQHDEHEHPGDEVRCARARS